MFSGIVKGIGRVITLDQRDGDGRLSIDTRETGLPPPKLGASVAVNGVCLTVAARDIDQERFEADVSAATLEVTTLGQLRAGDRVNLEPALTVGEALDGHLVMGHVDGIGTIVALEPAARSRRLTIEFPRRLARYVALKGSICVDGVSLTVNRVEGEQLEVNVVPHTLSLTTVGEYVPGDRVNLEVDIIARYLERLLSPDPPRS